MKSFTIEYTILRRFLPALINGDISGLNDYEEKDLSHFEDEAKEYAERYADERGISPVVGIYWIWYGEDSPGFTRCEITQCIGDCTEVSLVVMYKEAEE